MQRFGEAVKGQGSCVLPSRTGHLLLPSYLPAYDNEVAVNTTLYNIIARTSRMGSYMMICWWVLQRFRLEGTLQQARDSVARYLMSDWLLTVVCAQNPTQDHWLLQSMDTLVAEYSLIQMARMVEGDYLLQWVDQFPTPPVTGRSRCGLPGAPASAPCRKGASAWGT